MQCRAVDGACFSLDPVKLHNVSSNEFMLFPNDAAIIGKPTLLVLHALILLLVPLLKLTKCQKLILACVGHFRLKD